MSGSDRAAALSWALLLCTLTLAPAAQAQEQYDPRFEPKFTYSTQRGMLRDKGLVTLFYRVSNRPRGDQLAKYLNNWKSKRGDIVHSPDLNLLSITDTEENIRLLQRILEIIDTPEPQVMIQAKVVEVTYDSEFQYGGEAELFTPTEKDGGLLRRIDETFNPDSFLNALATNQQFQGAQFDFRQLGRENREWSQVRATIRTLMERGNAEILSSPRLMVQSGQQAEINTGQEVPIQEAQLRGTQSIITTRFKKLGITLRVKPFLIGGRSVDMDVTAEVSAISGFTDGGTLGISNPIISSRSVKTRVNVRDGETLIIGGLLRNESVIEQRGVPLISDLPIVGFLFKSYRRSSAKQELIFFLTPTIQRQARPLVPPSEQR